MKRLVQGRAYVVLPGGSVEPGETFEQAAVRELWEESTPRGGVNRQLLAGGHNGREARYFLMADVVGEPQLSGPELQDHCADNSFELMWASADEFEDLGLFPEHLRTDLLRLMAL
jgi:ADP-ribose pyrophosphatase YjhB (NUDIX family)